MTDLFLIPVSTFSGARAFASNFITPTDPLDFGVPIVQVANEPAATERAANIMCMVEMPV